MTECETCGDTGQKYYRDSGAFLPCDDCKPKERGMSYPPPEDFVKYAKTMPKPTEPSVDVDAPFSKAEGSDSHGGLRGELRDAIIKIWMDGQFAESGGGTDALTDRLMPLVEAADRCVNSCTCKGQCASCEAHKRGLRKFWKGGE